MFGAIAGDVIGSHYEIFSTKEFEFLLLPDGHRFTDDTVLTTAVADWILHGGDLADRFHEYFHSFPTAIYGAAFTNWASGRNREPYNSWGNGAAMRVSPIGWACDSLETVLETARQSAVVTHNHPERIRGPQAAAMAVFLARTTQDKSAIRFYIESEFGYDLSRTLRDPARLFLSIVMPKIRARVDHRSSGIRLVRTCDSGCCVTGWRRRYHGLYRRWNRRSILRANPQRNPQQSTRRTRRLILKVVNEFIERFMTVG